MKEGEGEDEDESKEDDSSGGDVAIVAGDTTEDKEWTKDEDGNRGGLARCLEPRRIIGVVSRLRAAVADTEPAFRCTAGAGFAGLAAGETVISMAPTTIWTIITAAIKRISTRQQAG